MKKILLLSLIAYSFCFRAQNYEQFFTPENLTGSGVLSEPLALAHAPSGKIFIAERRGSIKVYQFGVVNTIFTVPTHIVNENGLLGITLHPSFTNEGWLYFFYCSPLPNKFHNIERIYINSDNTIRSREFLFSLDDYLNGAHNGGGMVFKDGDLYIAVGDGNVASSSQNLDLYRGKILRVTATGQPVASNPYNIPGASAVRQRIWAYGFRNPFKITVDPTTNRLLVIDVGTAWEEINDVTNPGTLRNYNWGLSGEADGFKNSPNSIDPIYAYRTGSAEGCAITNLVGFGPSSTNYPSELRGRLLFIDYCRSELRSIPSGGNPVQGTSTLLEPGLAYNTLGLSTGIDGNLYYVNFGGAGLFRLRYQNNQLPFISTQPMSQRVFVGNNVTLSVSVSGSAPFTYLWRRDGVVVGTNSPNLTINNVQLANAGNYTVEITNSFGRTVSNVAVLTVNAFNARPTATIILPASGLTWANGDILNFQGSATDPEDGVLPASSFSWELQFNHRDTETSGHYHPGGSLTGVRQGTFTLDNTGEKSPNVWFSLILNVIDNNGNRSSDTVEIYPRKINVNVNSVPSGLNVFASIREAATPFQIEAVANGPATLTVTSPQTRNGNVYVFSRWEHGGAADQSLTLGTTNVIYTAVFTLQANPSQTPYGAVKVIPGLVQAEDYDNGGQGVAYNDLTTGNSGNSYRTTENVDIEACSEGGFNLAYVSASEWTEYSVNSTQAGRYNITLRVATPNTGTRAHLEINGIDITGPIIIPNTGGYQAWQSVTVTTNSNISLGNQIVRLVMDGSNFNVNSINFTAVTTSNLSPVVNITLPANNAVFTAPANVTINASISDADGTIARVEFLNGTTILNPTNTVGTLRSFVWNNVAAGSYTLRVRATDNSGNVTTSAPITIQLNNNTVNSQNPYGGITKAIPGRIEIEEFDLGGQGIAFNELSSVKFGAPFRTENVDLENCGDIGGGYNVGWVQNSEWLEYTVNVATTGNYTLTARVATPYTGRRMHLEIAGTNISGSIIIPQTGGFQAWQNVVVPNIPLTAGVRVLRVVLDSDDFNINYLTFSTSASKPSDILNIAEIEESKNLNNSLLIYPNPSTGKIIITKNIFESSEIKTELLDANGSVIIEKIVSSEAGIFKQEFDLSDFSTGIYFVKMTIGDSMSFEKFVKN